MPKNFYITTAIPYGNAYPHVGFAMEAIQTDAIARYQKQRGRTVRFQTGTDDHGIKIQKTAAETGKEPKEMVDGTAQKYRDLRAALNLTFDDFIQTSDQAKHWGGAQKMWRTLAAAGKLEKRKYKGLYCSGCEEFKNEKDLVEGKCPNHQNRELDEVEEENWFFRLSDYSDQIQELLESKKVEILPHFRAKEFLNVVKEGLHDVSFSRSSATLRWGIPVPDDDSQTMYVWCDALTNYISALGYGSTELTTSANDNEAFKTFWLDAEKVHVIGKDIVRFHAGIWLGMLLAAELPLPDKIYIHGFITSEGQKMSKSLGNVVDPFEFSAEWGSDALRYYLLSEIPNGKDGDFSTSRFEEIYNSHLANKLGNLVSRVATMALKVQSKWEIKNWKDGKKFLASEEINNMWFGVENEMGADFNFSGALKSILGLIEWTNDFITKEKPWELAKTEPEKQKEILQILLETIRQTALALYPFLPTTAENIAQTFGFKVSGNVVLNYQFNKGFSGGCKFPAFMNISKPEILFPKKN